MPSIRVLFQLGAVAFLLACGSEPRAPKPPQFGKAFSELPLPPNPEMVSQAGSADALQLTVFSPHEPARVIEYYRMALSRGTWRLVSDTKSPDGSTALYAEHDGPPLWVRIWKPTDRSGTLVQLTGAVVGADTAKRHPPDSSTRPTPPKRVPGA